MVLKFELTEELELLRDAVHDFAAKELKPLASKLDRAETRTTYDARAQPLLLSTRQQRDSCQKD